MPENGQRPPNANGQILHDNEDTEYAIAQYANKQRKKKRTKIILYIILFAIFHAVIVAIFATTVLKVRTPRFRISYATLDNFNARTPANESSFSGTLNAQFSVRNANFGRYRYRNTEVQFLYRGTPIGEAAVHGSRVGWRSTRSFSSTVDLSLVNGGMLDSQLASDLSAGVLPITSQARMRGRVELIFVMRRNRASSLNCSMEIVVATQQLRNIVCR